MAHILITGASSGIGTALALAYASPFTRLALHGRSAERLAKVAAEAQKRGAKISVTTGDVTDAAAMTAWITEMDRIEPLTLVIANAGISGGTSGMEDDREQTGQIFAVNLQGVLNTVTPVASLMSKRGQGQIAIMSSLAGFRGFAGAGAYGASKAAVRIYGEALRADLAPQGVMVNVVCPGFVKTPMTDINPFAMPFLIDADKAARLIQRGLARNRACVVFPWPMHVLVRFMAFLPLDLVIRVLRNRPRKPALKAGV